MRRIRLVSLGAVVVLLGGCETAGQRADQDLEAAVAAPSAPEAVIQPEEGLSPRERLRRAIKLLGVGQAATARAELEAYLIEVPESRIATALLEQIGADPEASLGREHFLYVMRAGDSLSTVAKEYLGDALSFYLLARYNGIENPSLIKAGRRIKIPGTRPAGAAQRTATESQGAAQPRVVPEATPAATGDVAATTMAAAPPVTEAAAAVEVPSQPETPPAEPKRGRHEALYEDAERLSAKGNVKRAINLLEEGLIEAPGNEKISQALVAGYMNYATDLATRGKYPDARRALRRAQDLDPGNQALSGQLANIDRQEDAERFYLMGVRSLDDGDKLQAYAAFVKAVEMSPQHARAQRQAKSLRPTVAQIYHRRAMEAFRRQDLDQALQIWDKVLQIEPNHGPATLYRAQALDLNKRLQDLESQRPKGH